VPIKINGTERKFLVGTASPFSEISAHVAQELGLRLQAVPNYEIYTAEGKVKASQAEVETMVIGAVTAKRMHLMVSDLAERLDGVLGVDILEEFDADFDFGGKMLTIFSQDHCKGKVVYWARTYADIPFELGDSRHIKVATTLDGKRVSGVLDTGAGITVLSMATARLGYGLGESDLEAVPQADASSAIRFRKRFGALSLGDVAIKNPLIYLQEDKSEQAFQKAHMGNDRNPPSNRAELLTPELVAGMNILSKLHLYIAYKERMLYITGANEKL
jgi:predicted aspartyl protease